MRLWTVDPADAGLSGAVLSGGVNWQLQAADGTLDIEAHYVIRALDGALIEVNSRGCRHGPAEVMTRLAKGEPLSPDEYYFRTVMTFQAGTDRWAYLNSLLAIGKGRREMDVTVLDVYLVG